jgi:hypothetical protein
LTAEDSIRLLLMFYHDVRPASRIGKLGDLPGVAPSSRVDCPDCAGFGQRRVRRFGPGVRRTDAGHLIAPCDRCEGRGTLVVDDYTGTEVGTVEQAARTTRSVTCDGCGGQGVTGGAGRRCRYCEGVGTVSVPVESRERRQPAKQAKAEEATHEALRAARASGSARLWQAGSFAALERALAELTTHMRYRLWQDLPDGASDLVSILTARVRKMEAPGKIRVPSEIRRWDEERAKPRPSFIASKGERNEAMRKRRAEGASWAQIAREFGVSKTQAGRVVG